MNSGNRDGASESRWSARSIGWRLKPVIRPEPVDEAWDALGQLDARRKAEIARRTRDIGIGFLDVARRPILIADVGLAPCGLLDDADQAGDVFGMAVAQIVEAMRCAFALLEGCIDDPHQRIDDIVDVGEITAQLAAAEHRNRLALQNGLREQPIGHVGPSPRTIDREETKTGLLQPEEFGVGMRK